MSTSNESFGELLPFADPAVRISSIGKRISKDIYSGINRNGRLRIIMTHIAVYALTHETLSRSISCRMPKNGQRKTTVPGLGLLCSS